MKRRFNITGVCVPEKHYMVNLDKRLKEIRELIDDGAYFTINRARQYGKTTLLAALAKSLSGDYVIVSVDFQAMGNDSFQNENMFSLSFLSLFYRKLENISKNNAWEFYDLLSELKEIVRMKPEKFVLLDLFSYLLDICKKIPKPVVLMIDEVDTATNNQVFLDFLAQLRNYYLERETDGTVTFQSVILAGVYDVKNMRRKIRPEEDHKTNSPWNIATDFDVDMSFNEEDISGMLEEYEADNTTGMDIREVSGLIYEYTSGYPFLVSKICKIIDERLAGEGKFHDKSAAWTKEGVLKAVKILLSEKNMLFDSLTEKIESYPELKNILYALLFRGQSIVYNPDNDAIGIALMFGFTKIDVETGVVVVANRIFETRLYNYFLTAPEVQGSETYRLASQDKNQFIQDGRLNMDLVLEKFVRHFDDLYGDQGQSFYEEDGRRYFLLYLRPIINGVGNYYIESQTRNMERTDVIVDYNGEQIIVELKIWHGDAYNTRGEKQLSEYLDYYHLKKGYMLSFNFNKNKQIGLRRIELGDKILIEAVV